MVAEEEEEEDDEMDLEEEVCAGRGEGGAVEARRVEEVGEGVLEEAVEDKVEVEVEVEGGETLLDDVLEAPAAAVARARDALVDVEEVIVDEADSIVFSACEPTSCGADGCA